jgi:hypothetical protein
MIIGDGNYQQHGVGHWKTDFHGDGNWKIGIHHQDHIYNVFYIVFIISFT